MKEITVTLTIDEVNVIIESLGKEQFVKVYKLIEKFHLEAKKQLSSDKKEQK